MANELFEYDFWFHTTSNPLYEGMVHQKLWANPMWVREAVTDFCIEHEGNLDSYGFLHKVNGEFICPELDDSYEWEELEAMFRNGELGFYFHFDEQELADSETTVDDFIHELQSMILMEAEKRPLPTS